MDIGARDGATSSKEKINIPSSKTNSMNPSIFFRSILLPLIFLAACTQQSQQETKKETLSKQVSKPFIHSSLIVGDHHFVSAIRDQQVLLSMSHGLGDVRSIVRSIPGYQSHEVVYINNPKGILTISITASSPASYQLELDQRMAEHVEQKQ